MKKFDSKLMLFNHLALYAQITDLFMYFKKQNNIYWNIIDLLPPSNEQTQQ